MEDAVAALQFGALGSLPVTTGKCLGIDAVDGENVTKFELAISSLGNVRTRTSRAWAEAEYVKMISELP